MPHTIRPLAALVALLVSAIDATANAQVVGPLGNKLDGMLRRAESFGFSAQVVIAQGGRVIVDRAYGFADRANRTPMTVTTRVGIASTSKMIAAAALLSLEEAGKLSTSDSLHTYFPWIPADKRNITLHQVLTHTASLRGGLTEDFDVATLDSSLSRLLARPLWGPIGQRWRYASDGYGVIAAVVQQVSGLPYEQYVHDRIFARADMRHSGFWSDARASTDDVALAYVGWRNRGSPRDWPRNWRVFGSGDVMTTARDLYLWDRALVRGRVLSPESYAKYIAPWVAVGEDSTRYGYGWFIGKSPRNSRVVEHGGDTELGYNAAFFRYPEDSMTMIIVSNSRDAVGQSMRQYVQAEIERALFGGDSLPKTPMTRLLAPRELSALAGRYALPDSGALHLVSDGAFLWMAAEGATAVDLLRSSRLSNPAAERGAAQRTKALLDRLLARDGHAYDRALGDSASAAQRAEYASEWSGLVSANGPLHRFQIVGAYQSGPAVTVLARLSFLNGDRTMAWFWEPAADGRLVGSNPSALAPYPVVLPVAASPAGDYIVHDLWRDRAVLRFRRTAAGRLRLMPAGRRAAAISTSPVVRTR